MRVDLATCLRFRWSFFPTILTLPRPTCKTPPGPAPSARKPNPNGFPKRLTVAFSTQRNPTDEDMPTGHSVGLLQNLHDFLFTKVYVAAHVALRQMSSLRLG